MTHLFVTDEGDVAKREPGSTTRTDVSLPADLALRAFPEYTDWVLIQGIDRLIMCGRWNAPAVWIPSRQQLWRAGITAPTTAPTIAASGTGITASVIGKFTFAEITGDGIIHESNPSAASGTVALTNQGVAWSNLPTTHSNPRVTHKRLYRSVDGDDFLFVANVPLSYASYAESVATNLLGDAVSERRGVPPINAKYVTYYHRRAWYSDGTDSVWYSEIDEPESVHFGNELKTEDARDVTMLRGLTDQLCVGTRRSFQDIQGWGGAEGSNDFSQRIITQDIGVISNRGSKVVNDKLWFPSQDGYFRYGSGGFQFLMKNLRTYFRDAYEDDPTTYQGMQCAIERKTHTLKILVPGDSAAVRAPFYYIAHFLPCEAELGGGGELPYWTFDTRGAGRYDSALGELTEDSLLDQTYTGSCDGFVRQDGVAGVRDDGLDVDWYVVHKHMFMGDQSGDSSHAHTIEDLSMYVKSESEAWRVDLYLGDDSAADAASSSWGQDVLASGLSFGADVAVAQTSHTWEVGRAGRGVAVKVGGTNSYSLEHRGFYFTFRNEGEQPPRAIAG